MDNIAELIVQVGRGDLKSLARAITIVENELEGYREILFSLSEGKNVPVIGFTGPPGASPDPDTFRVQIRGLLAGRGPRVRVQVSRSGTSVNSEEFGTVEAAALGCPAVYRTDKHLRLVSNGPPSPKPAGSNYDDEVAGNQTILAKLGDTVTATMISGGPSISTSLQVARPPAERSKRTTLSGLNSNDGFMAGPFLSCDARGQSLATSQSQRRY